MRTAILTCVLTLSLMGSALAQNDNDLTGMTPVDGTAQTYFSGLQSIRCAQLSDSLFVLADPERKIRVCDASSQALTAAGYSLSQQNAIFFESYHLENSDLLRQFINDCPLYTNPTSQWAGPTFDFAWDGMTYVAGSNTMGKHVYAAFVDRDGNTYSSDTVLITSEETPLPITCVPDYDVIYVYLYTYDPETATSTEIGSEMISRQCNAQVVAKRAVPIDSLSYTRYLDAISKEGMLVLLNRMVGCQPCTDVLWGMQKTYDYYLQTFGLDSFDGQGTELYCLCNPPQCIIQGPNACALPLVDKDMPGVMMFGMGNTWNKHPQVLLHTIGHEFTHLVARQLSSYFRESETCHCRALDESFADIMGLAILHYATGYEGWTVCEGDNRRTDKLPGVRCFDHPEEYNDPSCYGDEYFDIWSYEPHTNAGVQNHMFYLLVTGGEGINTLGQDYSVTPMDRAEAEYLAFTVLTRYTKAPMTYRDAAEAWAAAASAMYGEGSAQLQSVVQAWAAVGLPLDIVTGIDQVRRDRQAPTHRYNLMGQPVGADYGGICFER